MKNEKANLFTGNLFKQVNKAIQGQNDNNLMLSSFLNVVHLRNTKKIYS